MYQFTFWFVYVVYVFDSVGFFWRGNRWNFDGLDRFGDSVLRGRTRFFCFGVAILQRFGGREEEISSEVFQLSH